MPERLLPKARVQSCSVVPLQQSCSRLLHRPSGRPPQTDGSVSDFDAGCDLEISTTRNSAWSLESCVAVSKSTGSYIPGSRHFSESPCWKRCLRTSGDTGCPGSQNQSHVNAQAFPAGSLTSLSVWDRGTPRYRNFCLRTSYCTPRRDWFEVALNPETLAVNP